MAMQEENRREEEDEDEDEEEDEDEDESRRARKMMMGSEELPWLKALVRAEFYGPCECETPKHRNLFCTNCMDCSFCENCRRSTSPRHQGHLILQVYKSSCRVGLRISTLNKLFDASDIQPYISNSYKLVYINKKRRGDQEDDNNAALRNNYFHLTTNSSIRKLDKCQVCGYELQCPNAKFCSIECKVIGVEWRAKVEACHNMEPSCDAGSSSTDQTDQPSFETDQRTGSDPIKRKSKRKGTPRRAPLF